MSRRDQLEPSFAQDDVADGNTLATLLDVIESGLNRDTDAVKRRAAAFLAAYRGDGRSEIEARLTRALRSRARTPVTTRTVDVLPVDNKTRTHLIEIESYPAQPLLLSQRQDEMLSRFIREAASSERLAALGLDSRFNLLLSGPPGTGKSFVAAHVAARLNVPFAVVRLDSLVSSLLGDTAKNIRAVLEYAVGAGFLFIDEIDAVAKKRDDDKELGEIKRVVNTLIQGLDMVRNGAVIIGATNHVHMLDPAIFRRFPYQLEVGLPDGDLRRELWRLYLFGDVDRAEAAALSKISGGLSASDIRELSLAARRYEAINDVELPIANLAVSVIASKTSALSLVFPAELERSERRAFAEALSDFDLTYDEAGRLLGVTRQAAMKLLKKSVRTEE